MPSDNTPSLESTLAQFYWYGAPNPERVAITNMMGNVAGIHNWSQHEGTEWHIVLYVVKNMINKWPVCSQMMWGMK